MFVTCWCYHETNSDLTGALISDIEESISYFGNMKKHNERQKSAYMKTHS